MSLLTPQDIADGWGNRTALNAENAINAIEAKLFENDQLLETGELEYSEWEARQTALRGQITPFQEIIRHEKARYSKLLRERERPAA